MANQFENPGEITVDDIVAEYCGDADPKDVEKMRSKIQDSLNEGTTEFRVAKYAGSIDDTRMDAAINLKPDEKVIGTWSGFQGADNNSEFFTLVAKKPKEFTEEGATI